MKNHTYQLNYHEIYEDLLFGSAFRNLYGRDVFYAQRSLGDQSSEETLYVDTLAHYLGQGVNDKNLSYILIELDYEAYVPFGKLGAETLDSLLKERDKTASFSKFKLTIYEQFLKKNDIEISEELLDDLNRFVTNYCSDVLDLSDPVDISVLIRRISGELENLSASGILNGPIQKSKKFYEIIRNIIDGLTPENLVIDIRPFLPHDETTVLREEHLKHLIEITNLNNWG